MPYIRCVDAASSEYQKTSDTGLDKSPMRQIRYPHSLPSPPPPHGHERFESAAESGPGDYDDGENCTEYYRRSSPTKGLLLSGRGIAVTTA